MAGRRALRCIPGRGTSPLVLSGTVLTVRVTTGTLDGFNAFTTDTRAEENITFDQDLLTRTGFERLRNVKLVANGVTKAYTVRHAFRTGGTFDCTMHLSGSAMMGFTGSGDVFQASVDPNLTSNGISDAEARAGGLMYETVFDDGSSKMIVVAPHGGDIDGTNNHTYEQAEAFRARMSGSTSLSGSLPVVWHCRGYTNNGLQTAHDRWHVTSTNIHTASFPLLGSVYGRPYRHVLSFHGQGGSGQVNVGGTAGTTFLNGIVAVISSTLSGAATVQIAGDAAIEGASPDNITTRLARFGSGSVQLEQTSDVRSAYWSQIAVALADHYRTLSFD